MEAHKRTLVKKVVELLRTERNIEDLRGPEDLLEELHEYSYLFQDKIDPDVVDAIYKEMGWETDN